jgi:hypothetical protein
MLGLQKREQSGKVERQGGSGVDAWVSFDALSKREVGDEESEVADPQLLLLRWRRCR